MKREAVMKKQQQPKTRYTPKPPPVDSFALSDSPLNTTARAKVRRWHSYHGVPSLFLVVDEKGRELCDTRFPYEPDALAHAEAFDLALMFQQFESELPEPDTQDQADEH
jgi:hypothetical protein